MNNSLIFKNENLGEVRVIFIDNEPLFCLSDICRALNLANPTMVLNAIKSEFDDDLSLTYPIIDNLGKKAKKLSLEQGAFMGAGIDPRYGRINTYSTEILKQIFKLPRGE